MPGGYGLGNYGGTWQHPSTRWEKSKEQRAQERSKPERKTNVENPQSMIPDRVPKHERDGTGGRHFRDALRERFFGEACDFLDFNVDDFHVLKGGDRAHRGAGGNSPQKVRGKASQGNPWT